MALGWLGFALGLRGAAARVLALACARAGAGGGTFTCSIYIPPTECSYLCHCMSRTGRAAQEATLSLCKCAHATPRCRGVGGGFGLVACGTSGVGFGSHVAPNPKSHKETEFPHELAYFTG